MMDADNISKNIVIVTDEKCDMCKIYKVSADNLFPISGYDVVKEIEDQLININSYGELIKKLNPSYIFLNLDSMNSGYFMSRLNYLKGIAFTGTKIWETDVSSDITMNFDLRGVKDFTARPLPPVDYQEIKMQITESDSKSHRVMELLWWCSERQAGRGADGKVAVFGLLKRGGKIFTVIIPNAGC